MKLPVVFQHDAERDFDDAIAWYEREQPGLGLEFKSVIDSYLSEIASHPQRFRVIREKVRRSVVRRFPYGIYFLPEEHRVVIVAIFHAKRNPRVLRARIG